MKADYQFWPKDAEECAKIQQMLNIALNIDVLLMMSCPVA